MHGYEPMTLSELREFADLDALGLLDEIDAKRFEQGLEAATINEQEMVRTRQATLIQRLVGTPEEELPQELRERVLDSVREEIAMQDEALAPIATIGRRRRERSDAAAGVPTMTGTEALATSVSFDPLEITRLRRSSVIWRAASFGLTAGLVAAVLFAMSTRNWVATGKEVASQKESLAALEDQYAQDFGELTNETSSDRIFGLSTPRDAHLAVTALIQTDPEKCHLKLQLTGFDRGTYEIGRMEEGVFTPSHSFEVFEGNSVVSISGITPQDAVAFAGSDWVIRDSESNIIARAVVDVVA
ncbi:MAG: hypothetical protein MK082_09620 [Phycisphaerales bacterium]|nr:hypothetical protein [Phycisphaerales bacterium]